MQYSGIFVMLRPEGFEAGLERLRALDEIEVHHVEAASSRVVVVVETEGLAGQEAALKTIRAVEGVVVAEPVYHYRPEDEAQDAAGANEPGTGTADAESAAKEEDAS